MMGRGDDRRKQAGMRKQAAYVGSTMHSTTRRRRQATIAYRGDTNFNGRFDFRFPPGRNEEAGETRLLTGSGSPKDSSCLQHPAFSGSRGPDKAWSPPHHTQCPQPPAFSGPLTNLRRLRIYESRNDLISAFHHHRRRRDQLSNAHRTASFGRVDGGTYRGVEVRTAVADASNWDGGSIFQLPFSELLLLLFSSFQTGVE